MLKIKKERQYNIVSLGMNCLPRTVLTRHGLKPSKKYGEKSLPFDLCRHENYDFITDMIEARFVDFFDDLFFNMQENQFENKKYDVKYVHERGFEKDQFEDRYKSRIENFNAIISSELPAIFVQFATELGDYKKLFVLLRSNLKSFHLS